jgi:DNA-binding NarL/FixJ family response regulator
MLKVFVSHSHTSPLEPLIGELTQNNHVQVTGSTTKARDFIDALSSTDVDVVLFPMEWCEVARSIRNAVDLSEESRPAYVVVESNPSKALLVKSLLYGFHGVVSSTSPSADLANQLANIVSGEVGLLQHPLLSNLNLTPGILNRELTISSTIEMEIVDLIGLGIPDNEISTTVGLPLQVVRNHIENLLHTHQLTHRTQLAVLRALDWRVPDFL